MNCGKAVDEASQTTPLLFDSLTMDTGSDPDVSHILEAAAPAMVRVEPRYATDSDGLGASGAAPRNLEDEVVSISSEDDACGSEIEEYEDWDVIQPTIAQAKPHPPMPVGIAPPPIPAHEPMTPFTYLPKMCILAAMGIERTKAKAILQECNGDIDRALECLL
jgi:hypothetical protein